MTLRDKKHIKYLLRTWRRSAERMKEHDKENLKELYSGLKKLSEKEYKVLWEKYYLSADVVPFSDQLMADKYNLDKTEYSKKRILIEEKLQKFIKGDIRPLHEKVNTSNVTSLNDIRTEVIIDKIYLNNAFGISNEEIRDR